MLLTACLYAVIFPVSLLLLLKISSSGIRRMVVLVGSYVLYGSWSLWFAVVLLASTLANFTLGKWIRKKSCGLALPLGIACNLLLLSSFKYLPQIAHAHPSLHGFSGIALPVGISFWTFQAMSYLFDCHHRSDSLDHSLVEFALYMVFFPVVISGPICRMSHMLPQFRLEKRTSWTDISEGLSRIATGLLMMQLARLLGRGILAGDGIASAFDHLHRWTGPDVWCLAFGYGLQLFFNFAGYSHIAIGSAKALGFTVPENFARPFHSNTPSIFWKRWHMSLSFWIRDYVFLPIAMLRREIWWQNLALILSMLLFGLWHGATFLFVIWGCYHGLLLVAHRQIQELKDYLDWTPNQTAWRLLSWVGTLAGINLGWIFFRAGSLGQAAQMISAVFSPSTYRSHVVSGSLYLLVLGLAVGYGVVVLTSDVLSAHISGPLAAATSPNGLIALLARWRWFWLPPVYALLLLFVSIIMSGESGSAAQLMYRRF